MYIKIVLKGYWTSQLCGSIGIHVHLSTRTLLNESQSISAQRRGYRLGMALALRASMSLAVWANTALDHQRARLWLCSCSLGTALRASTALALWAQLFGRARLWLFGHSSSGEHGSCSLGEHSSGSPGTPQFWPYSAINSRLFLKPQIKSTKQFA